MGRLLGDDETAVLRELNADEADTESNSDDDDDYTPDEIHRYRDDEPRYTQHEIDAFFRLCEDSEIPF